MKNSLLNLLPALVTGIMLISCGGNGGPTDSDEPELYDVTVSVAPAGAGTIAPSADSLYEEGTTVQLQASPGSDYLFTGWSGGMEATDNPLSLTVDKEYSLAANFELKTYELAITTEGEGTVGEKVIEQNAKEYDHGTVVELTASPAEGYRFTGWEGGLDGNENPAQITVDEAKEVTAVFEKKSYELTVLTDGDGAVDEQVVQAKTTDYEHGAVVELTASPAIGWEFSGWENDITGSENPAEITVDEAKEVTAVFEQLTFTRAANGVTIMCPDAGVGDTGDVDGETYTKREKDDITETNAATTCTSGITDMRQVLIYATDFDEDISHWDVSSVTDMRWMFYGASTFNQDISSWDVSSVTNMEEMFREATSFNQDISGWDVSNVTDMNHLFSDASSFDQDISGWDVSSVADMSHMFQGAASFNQDLSIWNVAGVTEMGQMFSGAESFNQDINNWDVRNVTMMNGMFDEATSFDGDLSGWDVSGVTRINGMFFGASTFNQDISSWDVGNVENMLGMFSGASSFNQDISSWDVSSVTDMLGMFSEASSFNQNLSGWCVTGIDSEPAGFASSAEFEGNAAYMPVWGTCPE